MPFTAFHPVLVWPLWRRWPQRFDFVALTVGAMAPDTFEPYFLLTYSDAMYNFQRDWTHSLAGALTLDFLVAVLGTILVARPLLRWANRRTPSGRWSRFAGHDILERRSWSTVLVSAWIGTLSHVLIDIPFHAALRIFYPFAADSWLFYWKLQPWADLASTVIFGPILGYMLYAWWWRPSRRRGESTGSPARAD